MRNTVNVLVGFCALTIGSVNADAKPSVPKDCGGTDHDSDGFCSEASMPKWDNDSDPKTDEVPDTNQYGPVDCDDTDKSVNPRADEIPDDGVDNDCVDGELETPAGLKGFERGYGCGMRSYACLRNLFANWNTCVASNHCTNIPREGKFNVDSGFYRVYKNCDGKFEVLSYAEYEKHLEKVASGKRKACRGSGRATSSSGTAPRVGAAGAPSPSSSLSQDALKKLVEGETTARLVYQTATDGRLGALEGGLTGQVAATEANTEALTALNGRVDDVERILGGHTSSLEDLSGEVTATRNLAVGASEDSAIALTRGAYARMGVGVTAIRQSSMGGNDVETKERKDVRGNNAAGATLSWGAGVHFPETELGVRFHLSPTADEGMDGWEDGLRYGVGPDVLFHLKDKDMWFGFGASAEWHDAGGNASFDDMNSIGGAISLILTDLSVSDDVESGWTLRLQTGLESNSTRMSEGEGVSNTESTTKGKYIALTAEWLFGATTAR